MSQQKLASRIQKIADKIEKDYPDKTNPPVLLIITNGAIYFGVILSLMLQRMGLSHMIDTTRIARYAGDKKTKQIRMISKPGINLAGKDVIVIEDLVDEGKTLNFLNKYLLSQKTKSIKYCVLAVKEEHKKLDFEVTYKVIKKELGPEWLVGFGMDSEQLFRGLDCIYSKV